MLIGLVGDVHWSQYSSIVRKRGEKYSVRLENLIKSVNWAEETLSNLGCNHIVYLGDFFDKSELNSEEISALSEIEWSKDLTHQFIVGNHEMGLHDLSYNSAKLFDLCSNSVVISEPVMYSYDGVDVCLLPYILERDRKESIKDYFGYKGNNKRVILSHNDLKDFQMGQFKSTEGFSINDIEDNCDLFINGHLHNGGRVSDKIINIGNLTGQNFSEDAFKYEHSIFVLDTDTMRCAVYENPHAFNFYKLDFSKNVDCGQVIELKNNSVVTVKVGEKILKAGKALLDAETKIIEHRIVIEPELNIEEEFKQEESLSIDHLNSFRDYIIDTLGDTDVVNQELSEILK